MQINSKIILLILLLIYFYLNKNIKEHFLTYEQKRKYYYCRYSSDPSVVDSNSCINFYNEINNIKNYILNNPVGYLYKRKKKLPLAMFYNYETREYTYYAIDYSKYSHFPIIHKLNTKRRRLYNYSKVYVPHRGMMKVKLYSWL